MRAIAIGVALAALQTMAGTRAQVPSGPFKSGVDAVPVDVFVADRNRPVSGLAASDFELRDNGVLQEIHAAGVEDVPFSLMLTLDVSSSVREHLDDLKDGARAALAALQPQDRSALITFSEQVSFASEWSGRHDRVAATVSATPAGGGTALFDGAYAALTMRDEEAGRRSLVLIFSDGADTASWLPDSAVVARAQRSDAVVYAVALERGGTAVAPLTFRSGIELMPGPRAPRTPHDFLRELADATGGELFTAESTRALRARFSEIIQQFRTRYLLTYTPRGVAADGWHRIDVRLKGRRGEVRARRGYLR